MTDGGVLCRGCLPGHRQTMTVAAETLETWEALTSPLDRSEGWKSLPMDQRMLGEIRRLANQYICSLLGWKPRLHDWWNVIVKNDRSEPMDIFSDSGKSD
jgi:hypothetical protein